MKKLYFFLLAVMNVSLVLGQTVNIVKDLHEKEVDTTPSSFVATSSFLFFYGNGENTYTTNFTYYDKDVWLTDGTAENTRFVEINSVSEERVYKEVGYTYYESSGVLDEFVFNDKVFFTADNGSGYNVYSIDGLNSDTVRVHDGKWYDLRVQDDLFFYIDSAAGPIKSWDGINDPVLLGNQLFSDGENESVKVKAYSSLMPFGDKYLFSGTYLIEPDEENPVKRQLFILDPAGTEGPQLLKTLRTGSNSTIKDIKAYGDVVYFIAHNDLGDYSLWVTNGTTEGTMEVAKVREALGETGNTGYELGFYNGKIYFEGDNGTNYDQLYVYDIAADEVTQLTSLVKADGSDSPVNFDPSDFVELDGTLYFIGKYTYMKEGATTSSTSNALFTINEAGEPEVIEESKEVDYYADLIVFNNKIFFSGEIYDYYDNGDETFSDTGKELFVFDPNGSTPVKSVFGSTGIQVFPNPSTGYVTVSGLKSHEATYELYDLTGKLLEQGSLNNGIVDYSVTQGVYILKVLDGTKVEMVKIMVK